MAPATTGQIFNKDEKVLCFHHELLYEAKVLDARPVEASDKKGPWQYKVHYKGWKNTWDDWVPQDRLRKHSDENIELARNLRKEMDAQRKAAAKPAPTSTRKRAFGGDLNPASSTRGSEERNSTAAAPPSRGTKRGREYEGIDKEEDYLRRPAVKIFMPETLKAVLVDDWEKVTRENRLVPLPSSAPVTLFLEDYAASESANRQPGSAENDILEEVIAGVKEYFNKSLGRILLYRQERPQYQEIYPQLVKGTGELAGKSVADVYGVEHLCRLFVSMPDLIAHTNMDSQAVSRLREELHKMTTWLSKNMAKYLSVEYEHASQEYLEKVK
ncbi:hypothetical protein AAFC00_002059 [Neodothiora populina]|uniref:Chromatin modification-related protein EAF3 n=1 Tax=Neodothiora populina TaxID=2781224 RepID=A0ABR3PGK8_9PEZI